MNPRLAALAAFIAVLPVSIEAPPDPDAPRATTRVEAMGGVGQYGLVSRGCEGQVLEVVHRQIESGGLVVEHETAGGVVLGVRGGQVRHRADERRVDYGYGNVIVYPAWSVENRYVNPFLGYQTRSVGFDVGLLRADERFAMRDDELLDAPVSAHLRFGNREGTSCTLAFMEDVPLESEGHLSLRLGFRPSRRVELAAHAGLLGPYDGALLGMTGRFWLTPAAAAMVRAGVTGNSQYSVAAGAAARWPARR